MSEEKEVVPETNGEGNKEKETNGQESEAAAEENKESSAEKNDETCKNLEEAIIRQVEYYFGDANLPRDRFLREQILLDEGWIPLEVMTKFNRLSKLTTDVDVIEKALMKATSGLLEVQDKRVRRNPELPVPEMNEEHRKELLGRTIYAKGFPKDSTLDQLLQYFKQHEGVENIIMRRYLDRRLHKKFFKGSIFVAFKTKEQAEKFMESKSVKYGDTDLLVLRQEDYLKQKAEENAARRLKREKKNNRNPEEEEVKEQKNEFKLPTGTVLHFAKCHNTMTREDLKEALQEKDKDVEIAYIDHKLGQEEGSIRLAKEDAAKEFLKLLEDGKLQVKDQQITLRLLEGDEEKTYLNKSIEEMTKRRKHMKNMSKFRGKNNFRGKYGKRRRQHDDNEDAPPPKVKVNDS